MAQLHYVTESPACIRVKLGTKTIGHIVSSERPAFGFRFEPFGGVMQGILYPTVDDCKKSLAPLASIEWAEGMEILREWRLFSPSIVLHGGMWHIFSRTALQSSGSTIDAALRAGGFIPRREVRARLLYVAEGKTVKLGERLIAVAETETRATADSATLAKRIANALNEYIPGDRGF
jgi:hypothetical protein